VDEAAVRVEVVVEPAHRFPEGTPSTTSPTHIGGEHGGNCSSSPFSMVNAAMREEKARRASREEMRGEQLGGGATGGWEEVTPPPSRALETRHQDEMLRSQQDEMLRSQQALARSIGEASAMMAHMSQSVHSELADVKRSLLTLQQDVDMLKTDSTRRAAALA